MKIAELQLKMLMGMDSDIPLKVVGSLDDYRDSMFDTIIPIDTTLMDSDIKQFDLQTDMARKGMRCKLQFAPSRFYLQLST